MLNELVSKGSKKNKQKLNETSSERTIPKPTLNLLVIFSIADSKRSSILLKANIVPKY